MVQRNGKKGLISDVYAFIILFFNIKILPSYN